MEANAKNFFENVKPLLKSIAFLHQQAYYDYKPQVDYIITTKITDDLTIQHVLDNLLDHACNNEVLILYRRLCRYYFDINPAVTVDYINYYREMWDDDQNDLKTN